MQTERARWAQSVLNKHSRQYKQVQLRKDWEHGSVLVKREFSTLKRDNQSDYYSMVKEDYQKEMDKIKEKHKRIQEEWVANKLRMEKLHIA